MKIRHPPVIPPVKGRKVPSPIVGEGLGEGIFVPNYNETGVIHGIWKCKNHIKNPGRPELSPVEIDALSDTGTVHLCIPSHIQIQLKLEEVDKKFNKGVTNDLQAVK